MLWEMYLLLMALLMLVWICVYFSYFVLLASNQVEQNTQKNTWCW